MDEPQPNARGRLLTRAFLVVFFGLALLLSVSTILGTWNTQRENDAAAAAAAPATDMP